MNEPISSDPTEQFEIRVMQGLSLRRFLKTTKLSPKTRLVTSQGKVVVVEDKGPETPLRRRFTVEPHVEVGYPRDILQAAVLFRVGDRRLFGCMPPYKRSVLDLEFGYTHPTVEELNEAAIPFAPMPSHWDTNSKKALSRLLHPRVDGDPSVKNGREEVVMVLSRDLLRRAVLPILLQQRKDLLAEIEKLDRKIEKIEAGGHRP